MTPYRARDKKGLDVFPAFFILSFLIPIEILTFDDIIQLHLAGVDIEGARELCTLHPAPAGHITADRDGFHQDSDVSSVTILRASSAISSCFMSSSASFSL